MDEPGMEAQSRKDLVTIGAYGYMAPDTDNGQSNGPSGIIVVDPTMASAREEEEGSSGLFRKFLKAAHQKMAIRGSARNGKLARDTAHTSLCTSFLHSNPYGMARLAYRLPA